MKLLLSIFVLSFVALQINAQKPNVLLIMSDDLNTKIGPYMNINEHTPNLDRLAGEGLLFTNAYCQYPLCGPSRASIMSGLYPETNKVLNNQSVIGSYRASNPDLSNHPSIAGFFREQGYFTARVSKIFHMGVPGGIENGDPGDDDPDSWDYAYNVMGPETLSPGEMEFLSPAVNHYGSSFVRMKLKEGLDRTQTDYVATSQAIAILESRAAKVIPGATNKLKKKANAPFFLAVGLVRPHLPYIAPESCFEPYDDDEMIVPCSTVGENVPDAALKLRNENKWKMNRVQQQKSISGYMASVRYMDQQVGRLLDALDRLNLRENTIVVFISDHGFNLGEHGCWQKQSLWEGTVRIPMVISTPKQVKSKGKTSNSIVELIDLYPTLVDLCGFKADKPEILQGQSLANYINNFQIESEVKLAYTVTNKGNAASIRTTRWRYTRWGEKAEIKNEELYDHSSDPEEKINLVDNPKFKKELEELRAVFEDKKRSAGSFEITE